MTTECSNPRCETKLKINQKAFDIILVTMQDKTEWEEGFSTEESLGLFCPSCVQTAFDNLRLDIGKLTGVKREPTYTFQQVGKGTPPESLIKGLTLALGKNRVDPDEVAILDVGGSKSDGWECDIAIGTDIGNISENHFGQTPEELVASFTTWLCEIQARLIHKKG